MLSDAEIFGRRALIRLCFIHIFKPFPRRQRLGRLQRKELLPVFVAEAVRELLDKLAVPVSGA
jgi:hypothetical protein